MTTDSDSTQWLGPLRSTGAVREEGVKRLFDVLLRVARHEVHARRVQTRITGPELDDIAHQAAADAVLGVLGKLAAFRGDSRFTTWAYRFAVLEVAEKLNRHHWRNPAVSLDLDADRFLPPAHLDPGGHLEADELLDAIRHAVEHTLTERQRLMFVTVVIDEVPLDTVAAQWGISRNAVYKTVFDARQKIRGFLVTNGYLVTGIHSSAGSARRPERRRTTSTHRWPCGAAPGR